MEETTHLRLDVRNADLSVPFYAALLGVPPSRPSDGRAVFAVESPPLVLTLEQRAHKRAPAPTRHDLVVTEPEHVGDAAMALRRAGVRLRLEDQGIEACDPDGHAWRIRFVPTAKGRAVVPGAGPPPGSRER
jgi:catechol-2,3-dioxygenase